MCSVLFWPAKSCIVMAGFLLQEIINSRGPMLATWIQFWDHWSTTLLTGTVSPARVAGVYQIHAAPSRNCWRQFRVQQSKESLSSFVSALTPFVTKFFFLPQIPFFLQKHHSQFFLNLRSISFIELTSQYSGSDYPRFRSISIWNLNMVWIHKKKFSCVVWWGLSGLWSEESDVIRKKVNCSPAY